MPAPKKAAAQAAKLPTTTPAVSAMSGGPGTAANTAAPGAHPTPVVKQAVTWAANVSAYNPAGSENEQAAQQRQETQDSDDLLEKIEKGVEKGIEDGKKDSEELKKELEAALKDVVSMNKTLTR